MLSSLSDSNLNTLERLFTKVTLSDNQVLCREGSRADHLYVVKRGFFRLLKAFVPEDRPGSGRGDTGCPEGSEAPLTAGRTETGDGGGRLRHFDLGEIGSKQMLGESGLFNQPVTTSSSVAATPAAGGQEPTPMSPSDAATGTSPRSSPTAINVAATPIISPATTTPANNSLGQAAEDGRDAPPIAAAAAAAFSAAAASAASRLRQERGAYVVSAVANKGEAQAYVASISDLKRLQNDCPNFRRCLETARRCHQDKIRDWNAQALACHLQRQVEWEAYKRDVISENVRLDRIRHVMAAGGRGLRRSNARWEDQEFPAGSGKYGTLRLGLVSAP